VDNLPWKELGTSEGRLALLANPMNFNSIDFFNPASTTSFDRLREFALMVTNPALGGKALFRAADTVALTLSLDGVPQIAEEALDSSTSVPSPPLATVAPAPEPEPSPVIGAEDINSTEYLMTSTPALPDGNTMTASDKLCLFSEMSTVPSIPSTTKSSTATDTAVSSHTQSAHKRKRGSKLQVYRSPKKLRSHSALKDNTQHPLAAAPEPVNSATQPAHPTTRYV
jgi:hypothetical protein